MPDDIRETLPARAEPIGDLSADLGGSMLPPSMQVLLNEGLYIRMKQLAGVMAKAEGFTPKHLIGKAEACFTVINMSLDWRLSPHFVARHTYQTPGGQIGFNGALTQSVLEQSNRFIGAPKFEYRGDWGKLTGKFRIEKSAKGNDYVKPTWTATDAAGLGIIVRWQVRGEPEPRVWPGEDEPFWLTQCYPLNSPLWATDPKTQIAYLAIRRFGSIAAPGILGAASFDHEDLLDASERAKDVTPPPRPRRADFVDEPVDDAAPLPRHFPEDVAEQDAASASDADEPAPQTWTVTFPEGELREFDTLDAAEESLSALLNAQTSKAALEAVWEDNRMLATESPRLKEFDQLVHLLRERLAPPAEPAQSQKAEAPPKATPAPQASQEPVRAKIPVPPGKDGPNYRLWAVVSFWNAAKKVTDPVELAYLVGDHEKEIEAFKLAFPGDAVRFQKGLDDMFAKLQQGDSVP